MCGLVGIISKDKIGYSHIKKMTDKLVHRGPDAEGFLLSENHGIEYPDVCKKTVCSHPLAFGHRRLAILDLRRDGDQPMCYGNRYWIIYNGEIYNYIELREKLVSLGYTFRTNTDTEVILAAYVEWGTECLNQFNGMWAFALYDSEKEKLFISRDRFGVKPLYFYKTNKLFVFASEIKAILEHPEVDVVVNEDYCKKYYQEGSKEYIKETAFKNIKRFSINSYCEVNIKDLFSSELEGNSYWHIPSTPDHNTSSGDCSNYVDQYYELLSDSVRLRLRSDVDVGITLSGGIDSSSIAYLCKIQRNKENQSGIESFSSVYQSKEEKYCDESSYINELSDFLGIKNNKIYPNVVEFIENHREMTYTMECPPDGTLMASWYTYKKLGESGIKVNLEGQGADELLAGYRRYITKYYANVDIGSIVSGLINCFRFRPLSKNILFGLFLNLLKRTFPQNTVFKFMLNIGYKENPYYSLSESMLVDLNQDLVNLLKYADSESMHNSVETRFPFLDYRLVEFLVKLPINCKIRDGWTKYMSRIVFNRKLPDNIVWRKDKMGWPVPELYWMREKHFDYISKKIRASHFLETLIGKGEIERVLAKNSEVKLLVRLFNLTIWHEVYFEETGRVCRTYMIQ